MSDFLKSLLISIVLTIGFDMVWLGFAAKSFYDRELAMFERTFRLTPAVLIYLIIPLGVVLFVLPKSNGHPMQALMWGALYGFILYGVYDLTNFAIFSKWTISMTVIDMLWGAFLCGMVSFLTITFLNHLNG